MEGITPTLICSYRPARQPFHPTLVRPVFDKVRVVHTLCPREHPLQIFVQTILQVDTCPHEDHGHKSKRNEQVIVEVNHNINSRVTKANVIRCITFEMEIEVTFETLELSSNRRSFGFLAAHQPSIKAKLFDWPRRDSDRAVIDIDVSYKQLCKFRPELVEQISDHLQYLRNTHKKESKVIKWSYDPLKEGYLGDTSSTAQIQESRLTSILTAFAQRHRKFDNKFIDYFKSNMNLCFYGWFWKSKFFSSQGLSLIKQIEEHSDDPEQLADLKERIKQILSLLLNVVKLFQDLVISRLPGMDICDTMDDKVLPYNRMVDGLQAALANNLEDLGALSELLKQDPVQFVQDCILAKPGRAVDALYRKYRSYEGKLGELKAVWSSFGVSECILSYDPLDHAMCGVLFSCMNGLARLNEKRSIWDGTSRILHSETPSEAGPSAPTVHHPKLFLNLDRDLKIQQIPSEKATQPLENSKSISLMMLDQLCSPLKLARIGKKLALSGTGETTFYVWITPKLDSYDALRSKDFKQLQQADFSGKALGDLKIVKHDRLDAGNYSTLIAIFKLQPESQNLGLFVVSSPLASESPRISSNLFSLRQIAQQKLELTSIFLNKHNQFFAFCLEQQSEPHNLVMMGHLTAFKLKEANLDLCFSTKIELECPKVAGPGLNPKRSSRFFTAGSRVFFIFSVSSESFVLYTVYKGAFCRVSGGKVTDDPASPVYNYPAMTSMLESRDKRGQPGNSLYYSRRLKEIRTDKGAHEVFRMRVKL